MREKVDPPSVEAINRTWKVKKEAIAATKEKETTRASPQCDPGSEAG